MTFFYFFKNNAFNVLIAKSIAHYYPDFVTRFEMDNNKNNINKKIENIKNNMRINSHIINTTTFILNNY